MINFTFRGNVIAFSISIGLQPSFFAHELSNESVAEPSRKSINSFKNG